MTRERAKERKKGKGEKRKKERERKDRRNARCLGLRPYAEALQVTGSVMEITRITEKHSERELNKATNLRSPMLRLALW